MIRRVTFEGSTWADPPQRFEAGTPNVDGAVGLGAALDWLGRLDRLALEHHEADLLARATAGLSQLPGVRVLGQPRERGPVLSFVVDAVHPHDLASLLDADGIAIRAGHHCTQPLMASLGLSATARASFAAHTTRAEVELLVAAVARCRERFAP
jgi:cysteine desulfurase/selenocysteine lyase